MYDYLIVGTGLFGAVSANILKKRGYKILLIDKRNHIGGNIYTKNIEGIDVHVYGAHIFHTDNDEVWKYVNQFDEFNNFINSPLANFKGELYHLPFNMNTFKKIWPNIIDEEDAKKHIEEEKEKYHVDEPKNLKEQAINLVGVSVYKKLIEGYTEKQWGRPCEDLPPFIIKRIPVRFNYDNNYFNAKYQGIPKHGYTTMIENMIKGCDIRLNYDFFEHKEELQKMAKNIIFTGKIDQYYNYKFGHLEYRSLRFETEILDVSDYQNNAVINYTDKETPFTRIIEHKYFNFVTSNKKTIITKEYPLAYSDSNEPYYPVNNDKNNELYEKYLQEAKKEKNIIFKGRLGSYKYYDMDKIILEAFDYLGVKY